MAVSEKGSWNGDSAESLVQLSAEDLWDDIDPDDFFRDDLLDDETRVRQKEAEILDREAADKNAISAVDRIIGKTQDHYQNVIDGVNQLADLKQQAKKLRAEALRCRNIKGSSARVREVNRKLAARRQILVKRAENLETIIYDFEQTFKKSTEDQTAETAVEATGTTEATTDTTAAEMSWSTTLGHNIFKSVEVAGTMDTVLDQYIAPTVPETPVPNSSTVPRSREKPDDNAYLLSHPGYNQRGRRRQKRLK